MGFASLYPTYKEIYFQEWGTCDESHYYEQEKESSPVGKGKYQQLGFGNRSSLLPRGLSYPSLMISAVSVESGL